MPVIAAVGAGLAAAAPTIGALATAASTAYNIYNGVNSKAENSPGVTYTDTNPAAGLVIGGNLPAVKLTKAEAAFNQLQILNAEKAANIQTDALINQENVAATTHEDVLTWVYGAGTLVVLAGLVIFAKKEKVI